MNSKYTVPVIPQNLSKTETVVQVVEVLDYLNDITQDILSRVNKRIDDNNKKLSNISDRIDVAASKIAHLKGAKKATRVFSSSKYPGTEVKRDYESIFNGQPNITLHRSKVKHTNYSNVYEPLTKLQFFHVKIPDQKNQDSLEGLGGVPENVKCVNDLLLFNTGKNLYKEFTYTDSLKGPKVISEGEHITTSGLGAAPNSINERSSLHQGNKENYFYTPKIEELPALDVPLDLPDLPGIADDMKYETDIQSSIAPSAAIQSQLPDVSLDLPNMLEIKDTIDSEIAAPPPPPPPMSDIPPPPPMQELPPKPIPSVDNIDTNAESTDSGPPPPNIPPPPAPAINHPVTDSHSSLMEAIRNAGGSQKANLRKTKLDENTAAPAKNSSPGDLMADLHSKLMMRRKGISGAKKVEEPVTADSTMARISLMIPPPVPKSELEDSGSTEEDDWDD